MRLLFARTYSWQSFVLEGLPARMVAVEKKRHTLASAVTAWNNAVANQASKLRLSSVSETLKNLCKPAK